ncbi:PQQ-dependent sugar dehydrogenase, partial [Akkermansiaceae bacterium]|nr:PQQ-dependent sugar dehydrogenase [Akkermansiaceae bacterium]
MKSFLFLLLATPALALPPEFELSTWAEPFDVEYPTALTAAADGTVYVSVDYNGSLGKEKDFGKVVSCRDTNGDGKADTFKDFVPNVDSPRGGHFVGDTLYLIHPPFLSSFRDTTGDGVADEHKVLLENIGFGLLHPRGSDHTTNGCRMGIDGWLYIAVGDFGMEDTKGTDGKVVRLHGGGVARVRPDGTELEVYSYNTRNICDVAISPTLDLFTRDNTNDGKGWNIRVHHFTNGSDHGYPRLYKNFKDEAVEPMLDLGGGSGTGALYLAEPGLPEMFLNCDWTTGKIYHDALTEKGADFKAEESIFMNLVRATDIDVDGSSNLYVSDWRDGRFKFAGKGKKVGMVQKIVKKGLKAAPLPKFAKLTNGQLVELHKDPSAVRRLEAQRELLNRKDFKEVEGLQAIVADDKNSKESRVAAIFTIAQLDDDKVIEHLKVCGLAAPALGEFVLRALGDRKARLDKVSPKTFASLLGDSSPRLQLQAVIGLMRMGGKAAGTSEALIDLATSTKDARLKHTCIQALVAIGETDVLLKTTDNAVALQVLQRLHNPGVVSDLISQLATSKKKLPLFATLARLFHKEGPWDKKFWWGTRPDDRGPYFFVEEWSETPAIKKALETTFSKLEKKEQMQALGILGKNRIDVTKLNLGDQDPVDLALMAAFPNESQVQLLTAAAQDAKRPWENRVAAFHSLAKVLDGKGIKNEIEVLGSWLDGKVAAADAEREITDFTNRGGLFLHLKNIRQIAAKGSVSQSRVAWRALLTMTQSPLVKQSP